MTVRMAGSTDGRIIKGARSARRQKSPAAAEGWVFFPGDDLEGAFRSSEDCPQVVLPQMVVGRLRNWQFVGVAKSLPRGVAQGVEA